MSALATGLKNPDLLPLFDEAKRLLEPYAAYFNVRRDEPGYFDLWSEKDVVVEGRKKVGVFFAGLIVQKSYVGFYYMPVYSDADLREFLGPNLLPLLKGKSCFYLKRMTPELAEEITAALEHGLALYRERGWV